MILKDKEDQLEVLFFEERLGLRYKIDNKNESYNNK